MAQEKQRPSSAEAGSWYDEHLKCSTKYAKCVHDLLETLLSEEGLPYHSITFRVKGKKSFLDKYENKQYEAPDQITDVAALRIIAYTTADVERICALVEKELEVDRENSVDKASQLDSDQVGYLSVHYIVSLPSERAKLAEYRAYAGQKCEIQVRTLLQHAWAEIEHDRSYKFSGVLPEEIKRRFYLLAGVLELADREFQSLSDAIDAYGEQVAKDTQAGKLDIPIDSTSLTEFMKQKFPWVKRKNDPGPRVIGELHDVGIDTLRQLEDALSPERMNALWETYQNDLQKSYTGLLRDIMIMSDTERYFTCAWKESWKELPRRSVHLWAENGADINPYLPTLIIHDDI